MMPGLVVLVSFGYAAVLFAVAWIGDRYPLYPQRPWLRPAVYSLALAVYCTSWTFYGAVGSAVRYGIGFLPIYLGPFLFLIFGWPIIERIALIARKQNTVSIADFIAARYGRSQRLAAVVACIALIAAIPYLALQYKAVAISLGVLGGTDMVSTTFGDPALYVALLMAVFSILFGTRKADATEHRPGLMLAIAFESLVKLVALVAIGIFSLNWFQESGRNIVAASNALIETAPPVGFISQTLLAFIALICLPRQFHVAIVECGDVRDIRRARWLFGSYLVVISLMVLPIAAAGMLLLSSDVPADSFVLALPLSQNNTALALIAYVGGFSAATGMVIVVGVALATMVSNDLIMPILFRRGWVQKHQSNVASAVLWIRRLAIMALSLVAYGYYRVSSTDTALASYGLMSFAAVAQFAPGLIGGLFWRGASRQGVEAGLLIGFGIWTYTLLLPSLSEAGWFDQAWLVQGVLGIEWLRPHHLFGGSGWDPVTHGTFWSLLFNIVTMLLVSLRWKPSLSEHLRADPFLDPYADRRTTTTKQWHGTLTIHDLLTLASRIVGEDTAEAAFEKQARTLGYTLDRGMRADRAWVHFTELLMAAAVGAASARLVMTSILEGSGMEVAAVVAVLDEAGHELRFNRDILLATLENIDQGVSVVDAEMRLVAWNKRYQQLFNYPDAMLYVGRSVADLIRFNAASGEIGNSRGRDLDEAVARRVAYMQAGSHHILQRTLSSGQVIELRGRPLPGGGYVTSYSDVTDYKRVEGELREINETLEQRVTERTKEAESAHESRSRFLTAVSHDVLQPINAARLFASALRESHHPDELKHLAERVDTSLRAAEELLDGLLDVSRLDAGVLRPEFSQFDAGALLQQLADQYGPMASGRGLAIKVHARSVMVYSDPRLLRRVLQNFLANALRYTRKGRIVLSLRVRSDKVELQVWDTGPGIPEHHLRQIYEEFHRLEQPFDWDGRGMGLGLSICQRIASLLGYSLHTRSVVGRGSMFSIAVPRIENPAVIVRPDTLRKVMHAETSLEGLRVLCLDNDPDILAGMQALLGRWQITVICATTIDDALQKVDEMPDVLLVDYHLHDRLDGLESLDVLREKIPDAQGALLTADGSDEVKKAARERGYRVLTKPVKPASLRAFLTAQKKRLKEKEFQE
jgi:Na+/proline symporter/signal transduction histidine kinase/CheY-like chemotaxis protein